MSTVPGAEKVLTPEALEFVRLLHERFGERRHELLRAAAHAVGRPLEFLPETRVDPRVGVDGRGGSGGPRRPPRRDDRARPSGR